MMYLQASRWSRVQSSHLMTPEQDSKFSINPQSDTCLERAVKPLMPCIAQWSCVAEGADMGGPSQAQMAVLLYCKVMRFHATKKPPIILCDKKFFMGDSNQGREAALWRHSRQGSPETKYPPPPAVLANIGSSCICCSSSNLGQCPGHGELGASQAALKDQGKLKQESKMARCSSYQGRWGLAMYPD